MTIKFQARTAEGYTVDSPLQSLIFPDGAAHITGADAETKYEYQIADVRGMDHTDLFLLNMWSEACIERGERSVILLPYLPGARMDRGVPNGARVYAEYVSSLAIDQVITIDPHSSEWGERFGGFSKMHSFGGNDELTVFPVERIIRKVVQDATSDIKPQPYAGVIAPDKGAHDRAAAAAKVMGVPVYTGGKTRDFASGKLTGFHMEDELPAEGRFIIVDDICDGGGTFNGLADAIHETNPNVKLDLWVTHGIFSKGFGELLKRFNLIHTTDSYLDSSSPILGEVVMNSKRIKIHDITPYLYGEISL